MLFVLLFHINLLVFCKFMEPQRHFTLQMNSKVFHSFIYSNYL